MKIAIRYFSKSGNTKKIADSIADECKIQALSIDKPLDSKVDVLFLGCAVYAFEIDTAVKNFLLNLDAKIVTRVAIFTTSALFKKIAFKQVTKILKKKEIQCLEIDFYCKGEYRKMNVGKPDLEDIQRVKKFARMVKGKIKNEEV